MVRKVLLVLIVTLFFYVGISSVAKNNIEHHNSNSFSWISWAKSLVSRTHEVSDQLIVPTLPKEMTSEVYYPDHWQSDAGYFVLIQHPVASKLGPDLYAEEYEYLAKTRRVRILFESTPYSPEEVDPKTWVFLSNEAGTKYLGWVLKSVLLTERDFQRIDNFDTQGFSYSRGELRASVQVAHDGRFNTRWQSEGGGLFVKGIDTGQLYINEDIIWAKKDRQDFLYDFFILDETNHFQQEFRFSSDSITMNIYTIPSE